MFLLRLKVNILILCQLLVLAIHIDSFQMMPSVWGAGLTVIYMIALGMQWYTIRSYPTVLYTGFVMVQWSVGGLMVWRQMTGGMMWHHSSGLPVEYGLYGGALLLGALYQYGIGYWDAGVRAKKWIIPVGVLAVGIAWAFNTPFRVVMLIGGMWLVDRVLCRDSQSYGDARRTHQKRGADPTIMLRTLYRHVANATSMTQICQSWSIMRSYFDDASGQLHVVDGSEALYHDYGIISQMPDVVAITPMDSGIDVRIKLTHNGTLLGWITVHLSSHWHEWVEANRWVFYDVSETLSNRIYSVNQWGIFQHQTHQQTTMASMSHAIHSESYPQQLLMALSSQVGVTHWIMVSPDNDRIVTTVDIPHHVMADLTTVTLPNREVGLVDLNDHILPHALQIMGECTGATHGMIIPLGPNNTSHLIGYMTNPGSNITPHFLSTIQCTWGPIIYGAMLNQAMASSYGDYQAMLDQCHEMIFVLNLDGDIVYDNAAYRSFFDKTYQSLSSMAQDYPNASIIGRHIIMGGCDHDVWLGSALFRVVLSKMNEGLMTIVVMVPTTQDNLRNKAVAWCNIEGIDTFIAEIVHEIKNPLFPIQTFARQVTQDFSNVSHRMKCNEVVLPQLNRIQRLIRSLGQIGQSHSYEFEALNISTLIEKMYPVLISQCYRDHVVLNVTTEPNIYIAGNKERLQQVIINLFLNAIDAAKDDMTPIISMRVQSKNTGDVAIEFEDNGTGILPNDQPRLFSPFFTKKKGGTGLGTTIIYEIVLDHYGSINLVKSNEQGTLFELRFPQLTQRTYHGF